MHEKIDKFQASTNMISPSKLRMKFTVSHHQMKEDSTNTMLSSTAPPSHLQDSEFVNNLLASKNPQTAVTQPNKASVSMQQSKARAPQFRMQQQVVKSDVCNPRSVHPVRACGDEALSFEFHKGRKSQRHSKSRYLSARPMPSKWNDAEKWILSKQNMQLISVSKKTKKENRVHLLSAGSVVGAAPEFLSYEIKPSGKRVDFTRLAPRTGQGRKSVLGLTGGVDPNKGRGKGDNAFIDLCPSKDVVDAGISATISPTMRDMGTEMTPIPSQAPSRSPTPFGATSPVRSPATSLPSSPRARAPAPVPTEHSMSNAAQNLGEDRGKELSEQEKKHKITREIVALGVHLGKMNIVAWARKKDSERNRDVDAVESRRNEYRKRAAAWEEAEKSKHETRFEREEMRVGAWESQQKAKFEAEMRRTEARIEQMRAEAEAKMAKKMASAQRKAEEKRAAAQARKTRKHKKIGGIAKYICRTGRIPSTYFSCNWWSRRSVS